METPEAVAAGMALPNVMPKPNGEWEWMTLFNDKAMQHWVVGVFDNEQDAQTAAKALNRAGQFAIDLEYQSARLSDARAIIASLLLVLHDHSGTKKHIATQARQFLGLKPGQKVGSYRDKLDVWYPHLKERWERGGF